MPPKKKPVESIEPDVDVNGVMLSMRLADKLKMAGACFEVEHQNTDNKLMAELEQLRREKSETEEKAKKVIEEMTAMMEKQSKAVDESSKLLHDFKLDTEIAMEKWEKDKAFLEEMIDDQSKQLLEVTEKVRKEYSGRCNTKFHAGLEGALREDCTLSDLIVILTYFTKADPSRLPNDGYVFFVPPVADSIIRQGKKQADKMGGQLMGQLYSDKELLKKMMDERLVPGSFRLRPVEPEPKKDDGNVVGPVSGDPGPK